MVDQCATENKGDQLEQLQRRYRSQIRRIKQLQSSGAEKIQLRNAAIVLRSIKCDIRLEHKNRMRRKIVDNCANLYPRACNLPTDDEGFVTSFPAGQVLSGPETDKHKLLDFFKTYGFVIFRDIISPEECEETAKEIWDHLEAKNPNLQRGVPHTYSVLSSKTYGLAPEPALFTAQMIRNRCNKYVVEALRLLLGHADILLSHDRWCFYRPTKSISIQNSQRFVDMPTWKTPSNLHLDLNPWMYINGNVPSQTLDYKNLRDFSKEMNSVTQVTGPHLQGVLSITENKNEDGGTVLVPGFHSVFSDWAGQLGAMNKYTNHNDSSTNRLVWRGHGAGSFKFAAVDPIHNLKRRISLRAGSFLVWDQRIVHGSVPNNSSNPRMAQFIKAFRSHGISRQQFYARSKAIHKHMKEARTLKLDTLTSDSRRVLGLDPDLNKLDGASGVSM